jgi:hypothetical protein
MDGGQWGAPRSAMRCLIIYRPKKVIGPLPALPRWPTPPFFEAHGNVSSMQAPGDAAMICCWLLLVVVPCCGLDFSGGGGLGLPFKRAAD